MKNLITGINPDEALAGGIIIQAARDYKSASRRLNKTRCRNRAEAECMRNECLRFFRSPWFSELTEIDPEYLIQKLDKEVQA
jgi:hypothetical protein